MDSAAPDDLRRVWKQDSIPVIVRKGKGYKLTVKLPGLNNTFERQQRERSFLQGARPNGRQPAWLPQFNGWEVSQDWFNDLVDRILGHFQGLYIIQPHREQEKCAAKCMNAEGHECQCSCLGANHGAGGPGAGWFEVSETFATKWGEKHLACRLMHRRQGARANE